MTNIAVPGRRSICRRLPLRSKVRWSSLRQAGPRRDCVKMERDSWTARVIGLSASVRASNEISPSGEDGDEVFSVNGGIHENAA